MRYLFLCCLSLFSGSCLAVAVSSDIKETLNKLKLQVAELPESSERKKLEVRANFLSDVVSITEGGTPKCCVGNLKPIEAQKASEKISSDNVDLMDEIKKGTTLKKVEDRKLNEKPSSEKTGTRADLMKEIKKGTTLKKVEDRKLNEKPVVSAKETKEEILEKRLAERRKWLIPATDEDDEDEGGWNDD
ncbi:MAG: hypothetical protein UR26_C0006G0042 [candidate division TM6 bacterium GW2011_GWF2_32_72]|nr:MAG: hypothetical protein UR26_C0006G0042 [candidate division TM6 bacterium GW2011_GWF2_32_72]